MNRLIRWFLESANNVNLFAHEDDGDESDVQRNRRTIIQQQLYATRLYIILFIILFYLVTATALLMPKNRLVKISHITPSLFKNLQLNYGETLICPCSGSSLPYQTFVNLEISFNSVCSSTFVSRKWIEGLYLIDASAYSQDDFRVTASSQFELLAALCSISKQIISQAIIEIDNTLLVTVQLLREDQLQSEIDRSIQLLWNNIQMQLITNLRFIQIASQSNGFVSALNTDTKIIAIISRYRYDVYVTRREIGNYICDARKIIYAVGFYSRPSDDMANSPLHLLGILNRFYGSCNVFDAVLESTLDCFYDNRCIALFLEYFPNLNRTDFNLTNTYLSVTEKNVTVNDRLNKLFIDKLSTIMNYSRYFVGCAPSFCTYTIIDKMNASYTVTLLLSLYGSLTILLRFIARLLVKIVSKRTLQLINLKDVYENRILHFHRFCVWTKQLNLFETNDDRSMNGTFFILVIFNTTFTEMTAVSIKTPSFNTYNRLQLLYSSTIHCPCSNMVIPYNTFISSNPTFHGVCSSTFITENWISLMLSIMYSFTAAGLPIPDWRNQAPAQFQLLSILCQLANTTARDALLRLYSRSFVTSNVLPRDEFDAQMNAIITEFTESAATDYSRPIKLFRLVTQVDQPYTSTISRTLNNLNAKLIVEQITNTTNGRISPRLKFLFTGLPNTDSIPIRDMNGIYIFSNISCICAINPHCLQSQKLYAYTYRNDIQVLAPLYTIPGSVLGCFLIDSLLSSTLECLYSSSDCIATLIAFQSLSPGYIRVPETSFRLLSYNHTRSHFPPNTSVLTILENLMIEQWNFEFSYELYWQACAPIYCTYYATVHTKTFLDALITAVSMIGGLIAGLRFMVPQSINLVFRFFLRRTRQNNSVRPTCIKKVKLKLWQLIRLLFNKGKELNIFPLYAFGSNAAIARAKRLGQWATRLYLILLLLIFTLVAIYILVRPQLFTQTFEHPSLDIYSRLVHEHSTTLRCPCSLIASNYDQFIKIAPRYHQICSSVFISDEWRNSIVTSLSSNLSIYDKKDYRVFLPAHVYYLQGLCHLSEQTINISINQLLSTKLVTADILLEKSFYSQINASVEQSKVNAPIIFNRLLSLLQMMNHGNAIISAYATNFEYIIPSVPFSYLIPFSQAIIYDNGCSCGLYANCTTSSGFRKVDSSDIVHIEGFKIGCTPTESFLVSTLECFYNASCINLIQQYTNSMTTPLPLILTESRFNITATVKELIQALFIEDWYTSISYQAYFKRCAPSVCSYTYIQQFSSIYTVTFLVGIYGGLTVSLKLFCVLLIRLIDKIWARHTRHINTTDEEPPNRTEVSNNMVPVQPIVSFSFTGLFWFLLCISFTTIIIVTGIYIVRHIKEISLVEVASETVTSQITTTTTTEATNHKTELSFSHNVYPTGLKPIAVAIGDFNRDQMIDLAVINQISNSISILLGNGTGGFETINEFSTANLPEKIAVGDFNGDGILDLLISNSWSNEVTLRFGDGLGNFDSITPFSTNDSVKAIAFADLNNDAKLDIIVSQSHSSYVMIVIGNSSENSNQIISVPVLSTGIAFAVQDLNNDGILDLAFVNPNLILLFGNGNGSFMISTTIVTDRAPSQLIIDDFNGDNKFDVIFIDVEHSHIGLMLGDNDGSFRSQTSWYRPGNEPSSMVAHDFDDDGHLDLAVANEGSDGVSILFGDGTGTFIAAASFTVGTSPVSIAVGDFNGDKKMDLIVANSDSNDVSVLLNMCN